MSDAKDLSISILKFYIYGRESESMQGTYYYQQFEAD